MKDYIEVSEKTCCEVHNCICVKKLMEKLIAVVVETYSQNRRTNYDYHRNESLSECSKEETC